MNKNKRLVLLPTWEERVRQQIGSFLYEANIGVCLAEQLQKHLEAGPPADYYIVSPFMWKHDQVYEMFISILAQHGKQTYSSVVTAADLHVRSMSLSAVS